MRACLSAAIYFLVLVRSYAAGAFAATEVKDPFKDCAKKAN
jgi:hypothetical protein